MRTPDLLAKCEDCHWEGNCHPPEMVAWSNKQQKWLCDECWGEYDTYDEESDKYTPERPLAYAKDVMLDTQEQMERLIVAATKKRMGVTHGF